MSTYDEEDVVFPADVGQGDGSDLTNHRVERERGHGGDSNALATSPSVEDLGGD